MYQSLKKAMPTAHLYVFCFDQLALDYLKSHTQKDLTPISLNEFEDDELLRVKQTRTQVEYCWTCTPSVIRFCLKKYSLDRCTYLDADLFFFNSPQPIFEEMGNADVLITEHRFSETYKTSIINGIYNVQFMVFKNTPNSLQTLEWWRNSCNKWCYNRLEDGKLGDQKYLDNWTTEFQGIHVLKHLGGGMGPWNIQQYELIKTQNLLSGRETTSGKPFTPLFYHFHNFKIYQDGFAIAIYYKLSEEIIQFIYRIYLEKLYSVTMSLQGLPQFSGKGFTPAIEDVGYTIRCLDRGHYNGDNIIICDQKKFELFRAKEKNLTIIVRRKIKNLSKKLLNVLRP